MLEHSFSSSRQVHSGATCLYEFCFVAAGHLVNLDCDVLFQEGIGVVRRPGFEFC